MADKRVNMSGLLQLRVASRRAVPWEIVLGQATRGYFILRANSHRRSVLFWALFRCSWVRFEQILFVGLCWMGVGCFALPVPAM